MSQQQRRFTVKHDHSLLFMLCDIQDRLGPKMNDADIMITAATKLVKTSHILGSTLLATEQYPKGLGKTVSTIPLLAELNPSRVHVIEKTEFPMVTRDTMDLIVKHDQFILFGCEAHICVLQTAARLLEIGKTNIFVASDATGSMKASDHADAMATLRQWGVTVLPADALMFQLVKGKDDENFKMISSIVKESLAQQPPAPLSSGLLSGSGGSETPLSPKTPVTPPSSPAMGVDGKGRAPDPAPLSPGSPQNSNNFAIGS